MNQKIIDIFFGILSVVVITGLVFIPLGLVISFLFGVGQIFLEFILYFVILFLILKYIIFRIEILNHWIPGPKFILTLVLAFFLLNSILYYSNYFFLKASDDKLISENKKRDQKILKIFQEKFGGSYGFKYIDGKTVIEPKYISARNFSEGLGAVQVYKNGCGDSTDSLCKWGYINSLDNFIIKPIFDVAKSFSEEKAAVVLDSGYSYQYNHLVPGEALYLWIESLKFNAFIGKWGFIDKKGSFIINPQFDWALDFSEGYAAVKVNGNWGFIDSDGNYSINPIYGEALSFHGGYAAVKDKENGLWGYINPQGVFIISPKYALACNFVNDLAAVQEKAGNYYSFNIPDLLTVKGNSGDYLLININEEKIKKSSIEKSYSLPDDEILASGWDYKNSNCLRIGYEKFDFTLEYRFKELFKRLFYIIYMLRY